MPFICICLLLFSTTAYCADTSLASADIFDKLQSQIIKASDVLKDRVVHIEVVTKKNQQTLKVQGSGLIIDSTGAIITNEHVVDKAEQITILVPDIEDKFNAEIVGTDKLTDLALLKMVHPLRIPAVRWADIKRVRVGDWAIAIGNPYGLDRTVSLGIISAKGRAVPAQGLLNDFLQTDAMIDVGSSGGPLVNLKGEVLGINSMMMGRGIGFTVPADIVQEIIAKLGIGREIERSWVGIGMQPLSRDYASYFGIAGKKGVIVTGIFDNSPAEKAGLVAGDIIVSVNGEEITVEKEEDLSQFQRRVADRKVGETITFNVYNPTTRAYKKIKVKTATQPTPSPRELDLLWGVLVKEITPILYRDNFLFSMKGVVVTYVRNGSEAEMAGLQMWDIIQAVDNAPVETIAEFEKVYKKVKNRDKVMLTVLRNRDTNFVLLQKYGIAEDSE